MNYHKKATNLPADPVAVFERLLVDQDYCFLLETLADKEQPETTSQSYIGIAPQQVFRAAAGSLYIDGQMQDVGNPYQELARHMNFDQTLPPTYVGGLVGYFSHEGIQYLEPSLRFTYDRQFADFAFAEYRDGLLFEPNQKPQYFYYDQADRQTLYETTASSDMQLTIAYNAAKKDQPTYDQMITKARHDIQNGRVFQVVLANQYEYQFSGNLLALYKELRRINPSPFMFFMKFGNMVTLGASPELLAHTSPNGLTHLEALAGTIRRGATDTEDAELAQRLLNDEKEVAEHSMLVDLARNDVGRISTVGSVKIDNLMYIKKLSHVQHISSIVSGQLAPEKTPFDALAASFPAGTLSGAPKIEAIKMITELEGYERGPYGGTIGYFSYNGDAVHAVNIRSVSALDDRLYVHSGSGIVYDSNAEREYAEIAEKKAAMDRAMQPFIQQVAS